MLLVFEKTGLKLDLFQIFVQYIVHFIVLFFSIAIVPKVTGMQTVFY